MLTRLAPSFASRPLLAATSRRFSAAATTRPSTAAMSAAQSAAIRMDPFCLKQVRARDSTRLIQLQPASAALRAAQ